MLRTAVTCPFIFYHNYHCARFLESEVILISKSIGNDTEGWAVVRGHGEYCLMIGVIGEIHILTSKWIYRGYFILIKRDFIPFPTDPMTNYCDLVFLELEGN